MNEPRLTPEQVIKLYWIKGKIPIDPAIIAHNAGIEVKTLDKGGVSGEFIPAKDNHKPQILYNPNEPPMRIRFTIAHEIGHCFLNHGNRKRADKPEAFSINNYDPIETAANHYATNLLIPKRYLKALYWNKGMTTIKGLAYAFQVSELAMKIRLMKIGMLRP